MTPRVAPLDSSGHFVILWRVVTWRTTMWWTVDRFVRLTTCLTAGFLVRELLVATTAALVGGAVTGAAEVVTGAAAWGVGWVARQIVTELP